MSDLQSKMGGPVPDHIQELRRKEQLIRKGVDPAKLDDTFDNRPEEDIQAEEISVGGPEDGRHNQEFTPTPSEGVESAPIPVPVREAPRPQHTVTIANDTIEIEFDVYDYEIETLSIMLVLPKNAFRLKPRKLDQNAEFMLTIAGKPFPVIYLMPPKESREHFNNGVSIVLFVRNEEE